MVGYHAVDDRSRYRNDDGESDLNLSSALSRIIGESEYEYYKSIVRSEYAEKE